MLAEAQNWIADQVATRWGSSFALKSNVSTIVVVFNQLSWQRSGKVAVKRARGCSSGYKSVVLRHDGRSVPSQDSDDGKTVVFVAEAVPSFGYDTYQLADECTPDNEATIRAGDNWTTPFENDHFVVTPGRGGLASVVDKASGRELFDTTKLLAGEWMSLAYTATGSSETHTYRHAGTSMGGPDSGTPQFDNVTMGMQRMGTVQGWKGWICLESGPVRTVFASLPVETRCSTVRYRVTLYQSLAHIDYDVELLDWQDCFGVANRLVFPIKTGGLPSGERNVTFATNFGAVTVGVDEIENEEQWAFPGKLDVWLSDPGPQAPAFERGWQMGPREALDWFQAEADGLGITIGSSVGLFDWVDRSGLTTPDKVVLAPELLLHTNSNVGPFINQTGNHSFHFSIIPTSPGWRHGWRQGVESQTPLTTSIYRVNASHPAGSEPPESLPPRHSFLSLSNSSNLWVSAVKREQPMVGPWRQCPPEHSDSCAASKSGVVLRLFDHEGQRSTSTILEFSVPVQGAAQTNVSVVERSVGLFRCLFGPGTRENNGQTWWRATFGGGMPCWLCFPRGRELIISPVPELPWCLCGPKVHASLSQSSPHCTLALARR